jgi:hypothetical protein
MPRAGTAAILGTMEGSMWLAVWWVGSVSAAEPANADPVVLRIYAVDRTVPDPFAGQTLPVGVTVGACSGSNGVTSWKQACARVKSTPTEIEATVAAVRPWFAALPVPPSGIWAFGLPTSGGGNDPDRVEALLLRGPPVEVRRSDIAEVKLEDRSVELEWTPAGAARMAAAASSLTSELAFVIAQDRLASTKVSSTDAVPLGGTAAKPDVYFSLLTTWGDEALGARVVAAIEGR